MIRTKENHEQTAWSFACRGALPVTVSVLMPWHAEKITNICETDADGRVIPDRHVEGVLRYFERSYYLERANADNVVVDRCGGKSGCAISDEPFRQLTGATAQAEFCGPRLSKFDVSGAVIFQLTQDGLDRDYQNSRLGIRWTGETFLVMGGLLLVAMRVQRHPAS